MSAPDAARLLGKTAGLLGELADALRASGLPAVAAAVEHLSARPLSDAGRAEILHGQTDRIRPLIDRRIYLSFTCRWLARTYEATHAGAWEEAERWLDKASNEFSRFHEPASTPQIACRGDAEMSMDVVDPNGGTTL